MNTPSTPISLTLQSRGGFTLRENSPREGNVFRYHGWEVILREPVPTHSRFRKHNVYIRHTTCGIFSTWSKLYTTTKEQLQDELRPIMDAHDCKARR